jgi:hypothetical protein
LILALILLVAAGLGLLSSRAAQDNLGSYKSAPACATVLDDTSSCRLRTQAEVSRIEDSTSTTTLRVTLTETGANYVATMNKSQAPWGGENLNVEIWRANVTRLNDQDTLDNPEVNRSLDLNGAVAVIGLLAAICFGVALAGHLQVRSARGRLAVVAS